MKVDITAYGSDRKVDVQIDEFDTWNLDSTLALVIAPALKKFRENLHGYPSEFSDSEYGGDGRGILAWEEILDKMIWSFDQVAAGAAYDYGQDYKTRLDRVQEGLDLFAKYYFSLWD